MPLTFRWEDGRDSPPYPPEMTTAWIVGRLRTRPGKWALVRTQKLTDRAKPDRNLHRTRTLEVDVRTLVDGVEVWARESPPERF